MGGEGEFNRGWGNNRALLAGGRFKQVLRVGRVNLTLGEGNNRAPLVGQGGFKQVLRVGRVNLTLGEGNNRAPLVGQGGFKQALRMVVGIKGTQA